MISKLIPLPLFKNSHHPAVKHVESSLEAWTYWTKMAISYRI